MSYFNEWMTVFTGFFADGEGLGGLLMALVLVVLTAGIIIGVLLIIEFGILMIRSVVTGVKNVIKKGVS